jgi:F-type H+-transporting ATPase subunit epsilon
MDQQEEISNRQSGTQSVPFTCVLGNFEKRLLETSVQSVGLPALDGDIVVLPLAAPLLTLLRTGVVKIRTLEGGEQKFQVSGGIAQVTSGMVRVVCESVAPLGSEEREPLVQPLVWGDQTTC